MWSTSNEATVNICVFFSYRPSTKQRNYRQKKSCTSRPDFDAQSSVFHKTPPWLCITGFWFMVVINLRVFLPVFRLLLRSKKELYHVYNRMGKNDLLDHLLRLCLYQLTSICPQKTVYANVNSSLYFHLFVIITWKLGQCLTAPEGQV